MGVSAVNKIADKEDLRKLAYRAVCKKLLKMRGIIENLRMPYSEHMSTSWLKLWECSHVTIHSEVEPDMDVLDAGGAGTVFSFFLAAEGCRVVTVDTDHKKVVDANAVAASLSLCVKNVTADIRALPFPDASFDRVFSICVIEHIPEDSVRLALRELARVLRPGGVLALTFDKGALRGREVTAETVREEIIEPVGLGIIGNENFLTEARDYGTSRDGISNRGRVVFGSLFFQKDGIPDLPSRSGYVTFEDFPALDMEIPAYLKAVLNNEDRKQAIWRAGGKGYHDAPCACSVK